MSKEVTFTLTLLEDGKLRARVFQDGQRYGLILPSPDDESFAKMWQILGYSVIKRFIKGIKPKLDDYTSGEESHEPNNVVSSH